MTLEKALILRQFSFLRNAEKQTLAQVLNERALYGATQPVIEEALGKKFMRKLSTKSIYPKVIHTQEYLLQLQNVKVCFWGSKEYPALLAEIYDPPFVLFYRGSLPPSRVLSVVGSRTASAESVRETQRLGQSLVIAGIPVVSGLAQGIDTAIHQGVVDKGGQAFAVLATAVDDIYPRTNRSLAGSILYNNGGLLSETAPQEAVGRYSFAKRNRIISGLSVGTLVMAAAIKSGALITAQTALDQNREVFMWDHPAAGEGARQFLGQGASSYRELADLAPLFGQTLKEVKREIPAVRAPSSTQLKEDLKRSVEDSLISDLLNELGIKK